MYLLMVLCPLLALNLGRSHAKFVREILELTWDHGSLNGGTPREMVSRIGSTQVHVVNNLAFNTTVHWHGIEMRETPEADGVPDLSQTPIEPGAIFTYRFRAYPAGTFWYHSHYKWLMQDGQVGAMYIRRKPDALRPYAAITKNSKEPAEIRYAENNPYLMLATDWTYSAEYHNIEIDSGYNIFCVDSLLINGRGSVYCPGYEYLESVSSDGLTAVLKGTHLTEKGCLQPDLHNVQGDYGPWNLFVIPPEVVFNCTPSDIEPPIIYVDPEFNSWASLNFVVGTAQKAITFSVDSHPIPNTADYAIRIAVNGGAQVISVYAILLYVNQHCIDTADVPKAAIGPHTDTAGFSLRRTCRRLVSRFHHHRTKSQQPAHRHDPHRQLLRLVTGEQRPLRARDDDFLHTLLFKPDPAAVITPKYALTTQNITWVDIVLEITADSRDLFHPPHPIHKHGNRVYIIGNGAGRSTWENVSTAEVEVPASFYVNETAALRDTFVMDFFDSRLMDGAWMVIRYFVQDKFPSILHCHLPSNCGHGIGIVGRG
ncbi:multicopper oxidase-domain-containing protein [Aspergillus desertorum]